MPTTPFDSVAERRDSALLGIWAFLATEVLFFGPLFFGYVHGRLGAPQAFVSASHHMHVVLGTLNTAILMTSSLTMALAVQAAQAAKPRALRTLLIVTALLGLAFLGIKAYEYAAEWREASAAVGGEARFYFLYYATTGLHALHLSVGIALVAWLAWRAERFGPAWHTPVEVTGLYWHFVDVVWVFLYPMFYLLQRYGA
jgi:cytochrome c oxidase subunit 3